MSYHTETGDVSLNLPTVSLSAIIKTSQPFFSLILYWQLFRFYKKWFSQSAENKQKKRKR